MDAVRASFVKVQLEQLRRDVDLLRMELSDVKLQLQAGDFVLQQKLEEERKKWKKEQKDERKRLEESLQQFVAQLLQQHIPVSPTASKRLLRQITLPTVLEERRERNKGSKNKKLEQLVKTRSQLFTAGASRRMQLIESGIIIEDETKVSAERIAQNGLCALSPNFCLELGINPEIFAWLGLQDSDVSLEVEDAFKDNHYYLKHFHNKEHTNYVADDEVAGPVIISVLDTPDESEALTDSDGVDDAMRKEKLKVHRGIFRTKNGSTPFVVSSLQKKHLLEVIGLDEVKLSRVKDPKLPVELLTLEHEDVNAFRNYKVGVLLSFAGQTEECMFANNETTSAFDEFLEVLGDRITLQGWYGFRGGLDVKNNSTGTNSIHTKFNDFDIMFHVSTMLPFSAADEQQLERKRHLGNDIVIVIFREGEELFSPEIIHSHFSFVFIIVSKIPDPTGANRTLYKIAIAMRKGVPPFSPYLPDPPIFEKGPSFREFLLTKTINAERAAMLAPSFAEKLQRTREHQLRSLVTQSLPKNATRDRAATSSLKKGLSGLRNSLTSTSLTKLITPGQPSPRKDSPKTPTSKSFTAGSPFLNTPEWQ